MVNPTFNPGRLAAAVSMAALAVAVAAAPALASRESYVTDGASLFSSGTVQQLNNEISDFNRQTGKEIVVITVPSLNGQTLKAAVESTFSHENVNGVLFYFAKAEKQDAVVGDKASQAIFPSGEFQTIHDAMRGDLRSGDTDQAILTGVSLVLDQYRSHERGVNPAQSTTTSTSTTTRTRSSGGIMSLFWLALILFVGFLFIRAIFRALFAPRMMPPGYGSGTGPGYGGYGPGYGGGGGSFFSGLLGGLGGAWLGNELFNRGGGSGAYDPSSAATLGSGTAPDSSAFQSDAGQADMGGMGGGSWGDQGGGFDGGGGGFDGGGGGGDSGGGW